MYQRPEFREIFRRMVIKNSRDGDSMKFQANCLRRGVSEDVLYNPDCWDQDPSRVLGDGNKTMEMAIAEQLMQWRPMFDPEPQRDILRESVLAITSNPDKANQLVPVKPVHVTDSVHDAQLAAGTLMQGLPVAIKTGMNHIEYVDTLIATLATLIQKFRVGKTIPTMEQLMGMNNIANHVQQHIEIIAQDKAEGQRVKTYGDQLGKIQNVLKGFAQQVAEQQKAAAQNGAQMDPETQAKIQSTQAMTQAKVEANKIAHSQKTAQRSISFEREEVRKDEELKAKIQRDNLEAANEMEIERKERSEEMRLTSLQTAHEINVDKIREEKKPAKPAPKKVDSKKKSS